MGTKSENTPDKRTIAPGETIKLTTRFGNMSRGKCWGKYFPDREHPTGDFQWVEKSGGSVYLTGPGYYIIGSDDGFSRKARSEFYMAPEPAPAPIEEEKAQ